MDSAAKRLGAAGVEERFYAKKKETKGAKKGYNIKKPRTKNTAGAKIRPSPKEQ